MGNHKLPSYYLGKMIDDIRFIMFQTRNVSLKEFENNELLNSGIFLR